MDNEPAASQFCGYHGFGIKCSEHNISEISLGSDLYHVKEILYDNFKSIILIDKDVDTPLGLRPNDCPRLQHGINLETLPLNFSMYNVNLSFHYNCNGSPPFATEMQCSGDPKKKSYVHVVNRTEETDWDVYMCDHEVETTVLNNQLDRSLDLLKFDELLRNGFELQWRSMDACEKCEESGGWCGHHDGLLCFCSDGTTSRGDCKVKVSFSITF
ncbi:hypothetical protein M8C21_030119 [Ambrosia artemisiifolia]|uniref:Wall-associated receptor kinase C-terminal domain-containing protein n=1 Tax=Ambrosia artemisiifolia TaxID=4212 RepID=A0AAD5GR96_AMBAR|nr:hypothetical protein M8C21_030119 [Ambrosia artemisiifolia]